MGGRGTERIEEKKRKWGEKAFTCIISASDSWLITMKLFKHMIITSIELIYT